MAYFTAEQGRQIYYEKWEAQGQSGSEQPGNAQPPEQPGQEQPGNAQPQAQLGPGQGAAGPQPRAVIQILTGLAEMAWYYQDFAEAAVKAGYTVYLHEYRLHGRTEAGYDEKADNLFQTFAMDAGRMYRIIRQENPEVPILLLGHSLGTAVGQIAIASNYASWDGFVLTGPSNLLFSPEREAQVRRVFEAEIERNGLDAPSQEIYAQLFDRQNDLFKEENSPFSFITSDREKWEWIAQVPFTSPAYSNRFFRDMVDLWTEVLPGNLLENNDFQQLPVLILAGAEDVSSQMGSWAKEKAALMEDEGYEDVSYKIYPGTRHSILQDVKRDEVTADILAWMDERFSK